MNLDGDVVEAARSIARAERRSLGDVVSELARRGLAPAAPRIEEHGGFPVFQVPPDVAPITAEMVRAALDEP